MGNDTALQFLCLSYHYEGEIMLGTLLSGADNFALSNRNITWNVLGNYSLPETNRDSYYKYDYSDWQISHFPLPYLFDVDGGKSGSERL